MVMDLRVASIIVPSQDISVELMARVGPRHFSIDSLVPIGARVVAVANDGIGNSDEGAKIQLPDRFVDLCCEENVSNGSAFVVLGRNVEHVGTRSPSRDSNIRCFKTSRGYTHALTNVQRRLQVHPLRQHTADPMITTTRIRSHVIHLSRVTGKIGLHLRDHDVDGGSVIGPVTGLVAPAGGVDEGAGAGGDGQVAAEGDGGGRGL